MDVDKAQATIKTLQDRGYNVIQVKNYFEWALSAASTCDIRNVLWRMMEMDHLLGEVAQSALKGSHTIPKLGEHLRLLADLQNEAVTEVLATLKAKQCKCG